MGNKALAAGQAQAQAQRQGEIMSTESLELASIFLWCLGALYTHALHLIICHVRPLAGLNVKLLLPSKDSNAQRLVDWVEHGVHDAIQCKYLKALHFGFSTDPCGEHLLEEYVYRFAYDGDKVQLRTNGTDISVSQPTQSNIKVVKYQIVRLMRVLVEVCSTLDQVPDERYVYMKLDYYDSAPEDYEPPGFGPMDNANAMHFTRKPFQMTMGGVHTAHHSVGLHVKSALDSAGDEDEHMPEATHEQQNSTLTCTTNNSEALEDSLSPPLHSEKQNLVPVLEQEATLSLQVLKHAHAPELPAKAVSADADSQRTCDPGIDKSLELISTFCRMRGPTIHLTDAMAKFDSIPILDLERCFELLLCDGLLERTSTKDVYKVCNSKQVAAVQSMADNAMHPAHSIGNVMGRMEGLSMNNAGTSCHGVSKSRHSARGKMDSQQAGMFESNGSGATRSGMPRNDPQRHEDPEVRSATRAGRAASCAPSAARVESEANPPKNFFNSQQSQDAMGRKRKGSFVREPIRQGLNMPHVPDTELVPETQPPQKVRRSQRAATRRLVAMQA